VLGSQPLGVVRNVIVDECGNEVVAVIVAVLVANRSRKRGGCHGSLLSKNAVIAGFCGRNSCAAPLTLVSVTDPPKKYP
jgi:hypothetical protein